MSEMINKKMTSLEDKKKKISMGGNRKKTTTRLREGQWAYKKKPTV